MDSWEGRAADRARKEQEEWDRSTGTKRPLVSDHASIDPGRTWSGAADVFLPGETFGDSSIGLVSSQAAQQGPDGAQEVPTEEWRTRVVPAGMAPGPPHPPLHLPSTPDSRLSLLSVHSSSSFMSPKHLRDASGAVTESSAHDGSTRSAIHQNRIAFDPIRERWRRLGLGQARFRLLDSDGHWRHSDHPTSLKGNLNDES